VHSLAYSLDAAASVNWEVFYLQRAFGDYSIHLIPVGVKTVDLV